MLGLFSEDFLSINKVDYTYISKPVIIDLTAALPKTTFTVLRPRMSSGEYLANRRGRFGAIRNKLPYGIRKCNIATGANNPIFEHTLSIMSYYMFQGWWQHSIGPPALLGNQ